MNCKEELIIIRHARSQHNMGETDELDCGITEFGEQQASNVGKFLRHQFFDGKFKLHEWDIFTSPFLRCLQTTDFITRHLMHTIGFDYSCPVVLDLFREYLNHTGDHVYVPRRLQEFPGFSWGEYPEKGMDFGKEHNETFLERMHNAHNRLPNKSIVVTHGLPAMALLHVAAYNANYVPIWDNSIDNCSITWIRNGRVVWHGRNLYNEVEYKPESYYRCFILEP